MKTVNQFALRAEYDQVMSEIDVLIKIPDDSLSEKEADQLYRLAAAAQGYEKEIYAIE